MSLTNVPFENIVPHHVGMSRELCLKTNWRSVHESEKYENVDEWNEPIGKQR